jgi:3-isopropylmalate dehydrogenase
VRSPRRRRTARRRHRLAAAADRRRALRHARPHAAAETLETLKTLDGWILGPIGHRAYPKGRTRSTRTRSCASSSTCSPTCGPTRSYPDIGCLHDDVDLVIVRENNEGFQPDRNMVAGLGRVPAHRRSHAVGARHHAHRQPPRARAAFELARQRRKHLTYVHKDTVFKLGCGMFVEECRKLAPSIPTCASTT